MMKFIKHFRRDEDGAVTVDWVVLTAAVVALAVVAYNSIGQNTADLAETAASKIEYKELTGTPAE